MGDKEFIKIVGSDWRDLYIYINAHLLFSSLEPKLRNVEDGQFVFGKDPVNTIYLNQIMEAHIQAEDLILQIYCD